MEYISEQDIEFDRLRAGLTWPTVERYAIEKHGLGLTTDGRPQLRHLYAVSKSAGEYANQFFEDSSFVTQRYWHLVCKSAGLLHESMLGGASHEDLVEVSDEATANVVAAMTPDLREPRPKRTKVYSNRLGLANEAAQIVKLADLRHHVAACGEIAPTALAVPKTLLAAEVLLEECRELLTVFHKLRGSLLQKQLDALKVSLNLLERNYGRVADKAGTNGCAR